MNARKHPCSRDIPQDIKYADAVVFEDPDFTNGSPTLSEAEVAHFKEHGYVVKRGLLDEPETFERIVDYVWENVLEGSASATIPIRGSQYWTRVGRRKTKKRSDRSSTVDGECDRVGASGPNRFSSTRSGTIPGCWRPCLDSRVHRSSS